MGDFDRAYDLQHEAIELNPTQCEYWYNLGLTCIYRLHPVEAEAAWRKCLELNPDADIERKALAGLEVIAKAYATRLAGNPALSVDAIRKQEPVFRGGVAALRRQDFDVAAALFRQSLDLDAGHHQSWGNLGCSLIGLQRVDEAEAALRKALELAPDYQFARDNLLALQSLRRGGVVQLAR